MYDAVNPALLLGLTHICRALQIDCVHQHLKHREVVDQSICRQRGARHQDTRAQDAGREICFVLKIAATRASGKLSPLNKVETL